MAIESAPYYFAKCDGCGDEADYDEYSAFKDVGRAADEALAVDWTTDGTLWHCPQCPSLDSTEDDGSGPGSQLREGDWDDAVSEATS